MSHLIRNHLFILVNHIHGYYNTLCHENAIHLSVPDVKYCTDNAAMIGVAGYYEYQKGVRHGYDLNAVPNLKLGERV